MICVMRFSIRDLLWLTVVIGLVTVLWIERRASPPVNFTGQPLDVAISEEGFFSLNDPQTNRLLFTRLGSFSIDSETRLVLNVNGSEFAVCPQICIPSDATAVSISPTGRVAVQGRGQPDLVTVGQLQLAKFDKSSKLTQIAPAVFTDTAESGPCCLCLPGEQGVGWVLQGALAKRY
jgi:flagellar basal-body rod protein FlgG